MYRKDQPQSADVQQEPDHEESGARQASTLSTQVQNDVMASLEEPDPTKQSKSALVSGTMQDFLQGPNAPSSPGKAALSLGHQHSGTDQQDEEMDEIQDDPEAKLDKDNRDEVTELTQDNMKSSLTAGNYEEHAPLDHANETIVSKVVSRKDEGPTEERSI